MKRKHRCETCGKPLLVREMAARIVWGEMSRAFCFSCWDNKDEVAVEQYRRTGMFGKAD